MYRIFLTVGGLAAALASVPAIARDPTISPAPVAGGLSSPVLSDLDLRERAGLTNGSRYLRPTTWEVDQLARWGAVGRCVVTQGRNTSLAYVAAKRGSIDAQAAAARLAPAFASCLAGSGIVSSRNKDYRRAAVADALRSPIS